MPVPKIDMNKRLIFTVSSGRCGTAYLAELLGAIPGVASFHEPDPAFAQAMRRIQTDPFIAYHFWLQVKLPEILKSPEPVYAETSHLFCKGFLEPALRMGLRPALVCLRRPPREVAWSFLLRSTIPARTTNGFQHLLDPRDMNVVPLVNWQSASNYQLCFWYALEMERRYVEYAALAKDFGLPFVDITNRELNDYGRFADLLRVLGLRATPDMQAVHHRLSSEVHNPNKAYHDMSADLFEEEVAIWDSVEHFAPSLRAKIEARYGIKT
jgi:hypothetical protein